MPARRPNRLTPRTQIRRIARPTPSIEKSLPAGLTSNLGGGVRDMSAALAQAQQQTLGQQEAMPRDTFPYSFGPGVPLYPAPLDPTRTDSGHAEPRIYEYPVSWNIPGVDNRLVPWQVLRKASGIALIRDCIRIRKNEICSLKWDISISQDAVEAASRQDPTASRADIEQDLQDRLAPQRQRISEFWRMPDRGNGYTFAEWMSQALEEHLVLDALAIYPRFTYGGELYSLEVLDGSTIKPLLDNRGGRPLPPFPAYQQVLYGFPRGEFTADISQEDAEDGQTIVPDGYASDQLIYLRREVRTFTPYGLSAVEQSLSDADLWLKRLAWMRAEYTDGVMPSGWMKNNGESSWSPQQLMDYERTFNDLYSGITEQRQRFRILPPGIELAEGKQGMDERYKPDYDLHLMKLVVAHFDMNIAELGFTEAKGLGASGYHEGQENAQERKQTRPDLTWLESVLTDISRTHLDMPDELEFKWLGLDEEDQAAADELNRSRVASAGMTLNEWRDAQARPRYNFPEADKPMIVSQRGGVVFLEGASELEPAGVLIEPPKAPPDINPNAQPGDPQAAGAKPPAKDQAAKDAEKSAFRRYIRKGNRIRPFEWHHHDTTEVAELTKAGDADPKAPAAEWPGWSMDLAAAKLWAGRITSALTAAIDTTALARDWRQARKAAPTMPTADANAWMAANGITLAAALSSVLNNVYADGYLIGNQSAIAMVAGTTVDWSGWTPGNTEAATAILSGDTGLQALLDEAGITIKSIAAGRIDQLAMALADALEHGDSVDTLARDLLGVLDNPRWASMVATTELNRAMSAATLRTYGRNGIEASYWLTAYDERVCPLCAGNEDTVVPLNGMFPSGNYMPPAHPLCRCALAPVIASLSELDTTGMSMSDLEAS
jgi:SPP1 gp7 family putative phage head morphogenesis protein